jgi:hypothetical protein
VLEVVPGLAVRERAGGQLPGLVLELLDALGEQAELGPGLVDPAFQALAVADAQPLAVPGPAQGRISSLTCPPENFPLP